MPIKPNGYLTGRTMPTTNDQLVMHLDPWRASNLGTTTATITVPCPAAPSPGGRVPQIAIATLYVSGTGNAKAQILSGTDVILEYKLSGGQPIMLPYFPGNITIEPGENLTITVTGATADASVTATGVVYR
jgi:hypothetical protein